MQSAINRRKFLRTAGVSASALAIGFYFPSCKEPEKPEPAGIIELFKLNVDDNPVGMALNPFVTIEPSGAITVMAHKPDMGQGTFQSMPLLIAEELDVDLEQVTIKQAFGDEKYGRQGVGGSASVRTMWEPMRKVGAAAREMLIKAAADRWEVETKDCSTNNGKVINTTNQESLTYGELVEAASKLEVPEEPTLKSPADFKYIGKSVPRPDVELKVRGAANFGMDMKKEGMVYASVERAPSFSAKVKNIDDSEALKIKGVEKVLKTERTLMKSVLEGVAVIADNYWAALKGRKALKIEWEEDEKLLDSEKIFEDIREKSKTDGIENHSVGAFEKKFKTGDIQLTQEYETPFLAHSAMEPQNVLVDFREEEGICEIWAPTQFPQWAQGEVSKYLGIDKSKIIVHVSFLGGGFGRRSIPDVILEGCHLSKAIKKPVKLVWSREDDTMQSPMRPGSLNTLKGALDKDGKIMALQHKVTAPAIAYSLWGNYDGEKAPGGVMEPIGEPFYTIPNYQSRYVFVDVDPIPLVWWRSVYSSTNVFAHESFIDELAIAAKKDPLTFRIDMIGEKERDKKLLEKLKSASEWEKPLPEGWGRGLAVSHSFSTTAAHVVEVSKTGAALKIERVVTVIDCGIAVNPDNVKAQTEGNIVMALTAAIKDPITFKDGRVVESNFHNYRMLRINEMPKVEIHIMQNEEAPTGVGEPALPPLAPALCNAIFNLTGKRIRKLPFDLGEV